MRPGIPNTGNSKGFSLIEGLIAIAIFGFGVLSVITMLDVGFSAGRLSKDMTTATELAALMLDRVRFENTSVSDPFAKNRNMLLSFHGLDTDGSAPAMAPAANVFTEWQRLVQENLPEGQGVITVMNDVSPNLPLHYRVRVEVTFRAGIMRRSVVLETTMIGQV